MIKIKLLVFSGVILLGGFLFGSAHAAVTSTIWQSAQVGDWSNLLPTPVTYQNIAFSFTPTSTVRFSSADINLNAYNPDGNTDYILCVVPDDGRGFPLYRINTAPSSTCAVFSHAVSGGGATLFHFSFDGVDNSGVEGSAYNVPIAGPYPPPITVRANSTYWVLIGANGTPVNGQDQWRTLNYTSVIGDRSLTSVNNGGSWINGFTTFTAPLRITGSDDIGATDLEPVVIVPGLLGSDFKNGRWILQPRLAPYDSLRSTLIANGYVPDKTVFDFPYDWEKSNIVTAGLLKEKIGEIKMTCNCAKVNLIAHSMGGLVARRYIESDLYQNDVDQLIFLGTPHLGSPISYLAWEGGTTQITGPLDLAGIWMKWMMRGRAVEAGFPTDFAHPDMPIYEYLHSSSSPVLSFRELLPTYDYLRDTGNGTLRTYSAGYPENSFLEEINSAPSLSLLGQSGVKISNIYSNDQDTTKIIGVKNSSAFLPLWADGVPEKYEVGMGDGTVPEDSAIAINAENSFEIGGSHFSLPTTAEEEIVQILTGRAGAAAATAPPTKNFLLIMPFSPVDVLVTAPDGSKIGKDFSTGGEINQINGAYYSGFNSSDENIFIPNPEDGKYVVTTQGTGYGEYHILAVYGYNASSSATSSDIMFTGNTEPGLVENLNLAVNSSAPINNVIVPQDDIPPMIHYEPIDQQYSLHSPPVTFSFSVNDAGVGVLGVTSTLDGALISSPTALSFDRIGDHVIAISASDFVGNTTSTAVNYKVTYNFGGFLPPIKSGSDGTYNLGRTLPVKFQLTDANGAFVSTAVARFVVASVKNSVAVTAPAVDLFRYDAAENQYVYNLDTAKLATGIWQIKVLLDDGSSYTALISLK
ncbi:MAG: PxKF domain-containing protein [Candidatus Liptonbacteria bacterium]|nr:PxKF domain-containing protein [Candidatus Liptonbacteria bacterium]